MTFLIKKKKKYPFLNANFLNPKIPKYIYIFYELINS